MLAVYQRGHDQISSTPYISRHRAIFLHTERSLGAKRKVNSQRQEARNPVPVTSIERSEKKLRGLGSVTVGNGELQFPIGISDDL